MLIKSKACRQHIYICCLQAFFRSHAKSSLASSFLLKFSINLSKIDKNILTFNLCGSIIQLKGEHTWKLFRKGKWDMKKDTLIKLTKYMLDFMFYSGIVVTAAMPFTVKLLSAFSEKLHENYVAGVIIYFVLGIAAIVILRELRRIFKTVLENDCFVRENVVSLDKMCKWSFFIVLMSIVRCIVYVTPAMLVIILVFTIAGLFSKVLSFVFEEAVGYKEENDFTI